mmetsp:Transcript_3995/g.14207  ORF Transcript_3995/g.14207 Transcript_3995/m.14207 type:complete len:238 (-) Transcript_3995:223-936(-)
MRLWESSEFKDFADNLKASRDLPDEKAHVDRGKGDVQTPGCIVALLHRGHQSSTESPQAANSCSCVQMWSRKELSRTSVGVQAAFHRDEDAKTQKNGRGQKVLVPKVTSEEFGAFLSEFLHLKSFRGSVNLCTVWTYWNSSFGSLDLVADGACSAPLQAQVSAVQRCRKQDAHNNWVDQSNARSLQNVMGLVFRKGIASEQQKWRRAYGSGQKEVLERCVQTTFCNSLFLEASNDRL